jgi:hypothetical protein
VKEVRMTKEHMKLDVQCHSYKSDYIEIKVLKMPKLEELRYAFPDKPQEMYTAKEFEKLTEEERFERTRELIVYVINKNSGKRVEVSYPVKWPIKRGATTSNVLYREFEVPE